MKLKPYPEYKDLGVPWLGKIPVHWEVKPGFSSYKSQQIKNIGLIERTVLSLSYGKIVVKPEEKLHGLVPESFETYQIVNPGNIIIRSTDLQNDKISLRVGITRDSGIITSAYLCLITTDKVIPDYGYLLLHTYDLMKIFYGMGSGLRQNLDYSDLKRMPVLIPPKEDQKQVIAYFDSKFAQISGFIRNKRRLIELLKEQKQVIINQAVTRGIEPNVRLKPSGVELLGDITEHWEILPIKRLVKTKMADGPHETPKFVDEGIPFVSAEAVQDGRIVFSRKRGDISYEAHEEYSKKVKPQKNDVFIVKSGSTTGKICIINFDAEFSIWSPLALVRTNHKIFPLFMYFALTANYFQQQVQDRWSFGTQPNIGMAVLQNLKVLYPPSLNEQSNILDHISRETSPINLAISRTEREIALMREYRTRLIADVVTGKADVRDVAVEAVPQDWEEIEETAEAEEMEEVFEEGEVQDADE